METLSFVNRTNLDENRDLFSDYTCRTDASEVVRDSKRVCSVSIVCDREHKFLIRWQERPESRKKTSENRREFNERMKQ